jgi:hypothetical protein
LLLVANGAVMADDVAGGRSFATAGRIPVTKVDSLGVAPWTLGGVLAERPKGPRDITPGQPDRVYENTGTDALFFYDGPQPRMVGDDVNFVASACFSGPARVTSVEFAMYVNPGPNGPADFDAYLSFYNSVSPDGSPVNAEFLAGFFIELREIPENRAYTTGRIDIRPLIPDGILVPDVQTFVEIRFCEPGGYSVISERATPILAGKGVSVGSSADIFWADLNADALFSPAEAVSFGGEPLLANLYLAVDAVIEPPCRADFNHDSVVNTQDFFDFLALYFTNDEGADFNEDGFVTSQDYFDFLTAYFAGCP